MSRCWPALLAGALWSCSTVVPLQTASAVDRGRLRLGGQLTVAGYCGPWSGGSLGVTRCTEYPDGIPLPELRVNGRYGLGRGVDVGASLQLQATLFAPERAVQGGATFDVKVELLRVPTRGPTHVLSAGLLGGAAVAGRAGLAPWSQAEWGVPLFWGLQFERWELVAGASASGRHTFAPGASPDTDRARVGFSLGLFRRNPAGFALQLAYLTDPARADSGAVQLQLGAFFDVL